MASEIEIDPASFDRAASGVEGAAGDLQAAYGTFKAVMANLGDFLGNDDAGKQLKAEYDPAYHDFRTAMEKLLDTDLPALGTSLRNDGQSWRNADEALFGD